MTLEEFDTFALTALQALDDACDEDFYGTPYNIGKYLLEQARAKLFAEEIARNKRHAEYLRLKAEFEPTTKGE